MANVALGQKAVGSTVKLREGGSLVEFYVAKQDYESELNGAGRTLLVRKDCYDQRQWNSSNANNYATSTIDTWLNGDYKALLDSDIQVAMGTTRFCYSPGGRNSPVATLERAVFLLSATELGRADAYLNQEGTALSGTALNLLRIAYLNGSAATQWTRSPHTRSDDVVWFLNSEGGLYSNSSSCTFASRPTFTLPASLYVDDDGLVSTNSAPEMYGSIVVPSQINGGSTITIIWGAATDAEGNLEGYIVERSTDGGSIWTQIYQGGATSTTNTVPFGTESVMYRVKAYDAEGLESGWRTSGQVAVINNTAPTTPNGITVPEAVQGGQPLDISWGSSIDGENNLAGYSLERQVDGGDWSVIYSGALLSFTDFITKGWQTVAYRVRAYDTANFYSGFTVSEIREINNNTPPAIDCEHPANTNLGVKNEGFDMAYSVSDEEGDEVSITETVDDTTLRTFAAQLGVENHFTLNGVDFMRLLNGRHTLSITANDGKSSAVHSLNFEKLITSASVTLAQPMPADGPITVCVLSVSGSIPADAAYTVEVTNNGKDAAPVWEDCTTAVKAGANHVFENETAVNGFAFNFRLNVERGASGAGGYITSLQGGFQ